MIVVQLPEGEVESDARRTGRLAHLSALTRAAQQQIEAWLARNGAPSESYAFEPPMAFGTFSARCTDAAARLLRGAPGVQAVMDVGGPRG